MQFAARAAFDAQCARPPHAEGPGFRAARGWHASCVPSCGMDLLYLALTVGFFALSWLFVVACDRLS
jgi:hypothetical protein